MCVLSDFSHAWLCMQPSGLGLQPMSSSVPGTLQAMTLEAAAVALLQRIFRPRPRARACVSCSLHG